MRHFFIKSSHSADTVLFSGIIGSSLLCIIVCWARYKFWSSSFSPQGLPPTNISTMVQPRDQMSLLLPDPSSAMTSGAIHWTLPTIWACKEVKLDETWLLPFLNSRALPKSQSLILMSASSLFVRMLEHFRSRCLIFCSCRNPRPSRICRA